MRTLESLRNSCIDCNNDIIKNNYYQILPGVANTDGSTNLFVPSNVVLQPGRYVIKSRLSLTFDPINAYNIKSDRYKLSLNSRYNYKNNASVVRTEELILEQGGALYSPASDTLLNLEIHSNVVLAFDIVQDNTINHLEGLNYNISISTPYTSSSMKIQIIKLF
jgi:hypothetical protein